MRDEPRRTGDSGLRRGYAASVRDHRGECRRLRRWSRLEPCDLEDLLLVQRLACDEGLGERLELLPVLRQKAPRLVVAFVDDAKHFGVDHARRLVAERLFRSVSARDTQVRILARRKLDEAELLAHPPARDHLSRDSCRLLDVALGSRGPGAINDLLGSAT